MSILLEIYGEFHNDGILKESDDILITSLVNNNNDSDNKILEENFKWLQSMYENIKDLDIYKYVSKKIRLKLYTYIYFTIAQSFPRKDEVEETLRSILPTYFKTIVTEDPVDFSKNLLSLPIEVGGLIILYFDDILHNEDEKNDISSNKESSDSFKLEIGKEELKKSISDMVNLRTEMLKFIKDILNGANKTVSLDKINKLIEIGVFYSDTDLNRAALEFIVRMLKSKEEDLKLNYPSKYKYIMSRILSYNTYLKHFNNIKNNIYAPFFNDDGTENEERKKTFSDIYSAVLKQ